MIDLAFIYKLLSLAAADAFNPCELAVLTMVLMTLLLKNPEKRRNVLLGGLAFTSAVFILYYVYGIIIMQFFKHLIPATGLFALYFFKAFGALAIILGVLNVRDYLKYEPGRTATEMPLSWRPRVKMIIQNITSPKGAFLIGAIVTLFLLPCTAGPYIIFSGETVIKYGLSFWGLAAAFAFYNLIFVMPMIIITLLIYFGVTTIEKVSGWKELNVKKLHLIEGLLLIILGILMITGLI